jgi:PAS domain S-box-containing protein
MAKDDLRSRTMRIDLITDMPAEPKPGKVKRIGVAGRREPGGPARPRHVAVPGEPAFEQFLQSLYDAAVLSDLSGRIVEANERASEFMRCERIDLCRLTIFDVISGADPDLMQTLVKNLKDERFTLIQAYCSRRDDSVFPAEIAVSKVLFDKFYLCFFIRNIALRRAEEKMLRTEHVALHNAATGIAIATVEGEIEYVNQALVDMRGCRDAEEVCGQDVRSLLSDRAVADRLLQNACETHQTSVVDTIARRADGTEFDVQVSVACNLDPEGEPLGIVLSFADISDRKRAEAAMLDAQRQRLSVESHQALIFSLVKLASARSEETGYHLERVSQFTRLLGRRLAEDSPELGLTVETADEIARVSPLHDIGKVSIADGILHKPGRLTEEEFEEMKTHTLKGAGVMKELYDRTGEEYVRLAYEVAMYHHERWDGSGYPEGLAGDAIPISARILSLVDAYDAACSKRCYKEPLTHQQAREMIVGERGGQFDPGVVDAFLAMESAWLAIVELYRDDR